MTVAERQCGCGGTEVIGEPTIAPDRYCRICGAWHLTGHPHLVQFHRQQMEFRERITPIMEGGPEASATVAFLAGVA